mmetsp:Transcript_50023/g.106905  ORF Transcript_50023/g.106905 Transcript_50023/m.106905 type:complete len:205 (-) Transcript_50023:679-1293(-)
MMARFRSEAVASNARNSRTECPASARQSARSTITTSSSSSPSTTSSSEMRRLASKSGRDFEAATCSSCTVGGGRPLFLSATAASSASPRFATRLCTPSISAPPPSLSMSTPRVRNSSRSSCRARRGATVADASSAIDAFFSADGVSSSFSSLPARERAARRLPRCLCTQHGTISIAQLPCAATASTMTSPSRPHGCKPTTRSPS